jgi:hypothetical protein
MSDLPSSARWTLAMDLERDAPATTGDVPAAAAGDWSGS